MKKPSKKTPPSSHASITNTLGKHPGPTVPGFPVGLTVGASAVLAQEAQGTREVAAANGLMLPMDGTTNAKAQLDCHRIGIKLGAPVDGDPLFRHAELPTGWRTVPSEEDSRTTDLIDEKGNRRGSIWYKAASYDRQATMYLFRRYGLTMDFPDANKSKPGFDGYTRRMVVIHDRVTGKSVWTGEELHRPGEGAGREAWDAYEKREATENARALAWLAEHFQDHENVGAYWDAT